MPVREKRNDVEKMNSAEMEVVMFGVMLVICAIVGAIMGLKIHSDNMKKKKEKEAKQLN